MGIKSFFPTLSFFIQSGIVLSSYTGKTAAVDASIWRYKSGDPNNVLVVAEYYIKVIMRILGSGVSKIYLVLDGDPINLKHSDKMGHHAPPRTESYYQFISLVTMESEAMQRGKQRRKAPAKSAPAITATCADADTAIKASDTDTAIKASDTAAAMFGPTAAMIRPTDTGDAETKKRVPLSPLKPTITNTVGAPPNEPFPRTATKPTIPPSPVTSKQAAPRVGSNENRELRFEHEIQTLTAIALALLKGPNQRFYTHPFKKDQNGYSVQRELKPYDLYTSNDASPTPLDYQFQVFHKRRYVSVFVRYDNKPIVPKGKEGLEHCAKAFAAYFVMMTKNEKAAIVKPLHDAIDWQTQKTAFGTLFYYNKTNCFASYKKYDEIFEEFFRTYLTIFLLAMGFDSAFDLELEDSMGIEGDEATAAIELFDCLATDIDAAMSPDGLDSPTKDTNPTTKSSKKNSDNEPPRSKLTPDQLIYNLMELRLNNNKEEKVARANADNSPTQSPKNI